MPIESIASWTIKWDKPDFIGKEALEKKRALQHRHEYGIVLSEKGIAREGYEVFQDGKQIGRVTSGTLSPTLQQPIAIVLVDKKLKEGDSVDVKIRQNMYPAKVVDLPFYSQQSR
jgi:aminomethyltransferase